MVTVSAADGSVHGLTVNSFTRVSLAPPLVLAAIDRRASVYHRLKQAKYFGVNTLRESQKCFSQMFASRRADRFSGLEWALGLHGVPLLKGVLAQLDGCRETMIRAGTSNRRTDSDSCVLFGLA